MRFAALVCMLLWAGPVGASIMIRVDNASQRMSVAVDGVPVYSWKVSTARPGYQTPPGSYRVRRMERMWFSRKYDMSPMPHALFFRGGYAIHGTYSVGQLGRPASHGCVRLSPGNARTLFSLVQEHGGARVLVTGSSPSRISSPSYGQGSRVRLWQAEPEYILEPSEDDSGW
jgi:lipoprotein-anchoring transpeptidase ErfK/SrfK